MKGIILFLTLLMVCFLFFPKNEEIRIRVLSNSDSKEDLNYKDDVVNYFLDEIIKDNELTDEYFFSNYQKIEDMLNEEFEGINVSYEYHTFPTKTYNGNVINEGKYKTLLITIGDGLGSNWWGSVFDGSIKMNSKDEIVYEWYFKKYLG